MGMRPQDMRKLMQQAQKMQEQMAAAQEELATQEFEGTAGGGAVTAQVTGSGELVSVSFAAGVIDPDDPDLLGDLVVAAVNQALRAANEAAQSQLGGLTGGLDLGGLLG
jgi:nucleoid-associated protein EbfC